MSSRQWKAVALALAVPVGAMSVVAAGTEVSDAPESPPGLTVYSSENLALIRWTADVELDEGIQTVRIDGLPTNLDASSLVVLDDAVVLLGVHGFRTYQEAATGTSASLELELDAERRERGLDLAFLTGGLSWSAEYSMVVGREDRSARIEGRAEIANNSGASYEGAEVQLLAGTIHRARGGRPFSDELRIAAPAAEAAVPSVGEAAFGGYHLYTLSEPTSLAAGAVRQVRLFGAPSVRTEKEYLFTGELNPYQRTPEPATAPVQTRYRVDRPTGGEFGDTPLPAGPVRMFKRDEAGRLQLLGVAAIGNTPAGEPLYLTTGHAFDIVGKRTQTDYQRPTGNVHESAWKIELRNRTAEAVTVQVLERLRGDWRILESTHDPEKLSAELVRFSVPVAARGSSTLEYRVSIKS